VSAPHDAPDLPTIVEAVREFLVGEVRPELSGRLRYHLRVATNLLEIAERELALGESQRQAHKAMLARVGFASDEEVARAIRAGEVDDRLDELAGELRGIVTAKLAVAHPGYGGS
jgi:Domain of unknown function (DUF6285)